MLKAKTKKAIKIMAVNQSAENKIKTVAGLTEALAYITNPAKIYEVSRINCSGSNSNTLEQFRLLRLAFNQNKGIIAHHFIQSFSPNDNITPETVHRFGVEYVKQCFPNYQVVVSTHIDKEHLHNHIIVNSCNMITGKKFYDNKESMKNNRDISDKLCRKYGVSVISTQSEFKPIDQTTMQLALKQKSWKIQLLSDLDDAKEKCRSKSEFISFFKSRNYEIRYEKHITIRKIGEKKAIRVDTLAKQFGNQYTKAELEKAMGYSTNLADTNTNNVNLQSKKTCARKNINEWQRFESWSFSQKNRYANNYRCLKKQYGTNYQPSRFPKGTRKSLLLTLLCVFFVSPRKTYREHTNYRLSNRTTANTNIIRTKYRCENIRYGDLISAQGNNFAVKIPADQLGKIIVLPIFYSANVNLETNTAVITVKEYNKEIICQALGYDSKKIAQQSDKLINSQKYKRLKDYAASSNTKLSYMIVTKIQLELLKMNEIELAAFPKDDGKYNVAFMPDTKERINKILYPSDDSKQESEYERNSRINNEIKRLAAINGEKPKYRIVTSDLLDNIKQSGIQFAYFKKGDKYNIVFLRENEMKIDQLLKQFRKKN
jgi:hypothetical protein